MKGIYCLIITLQKMQTIKVGKSGTREFKAGNYIYTGSAMGPGGLEARIGRHMKKAKKLKWHIDYLRVQAGSVLPIFAETGNGNNECRVASMLCDKFEPVEGFGNSDCKNGCPAHLVFAGDTSQKRLKNIVRAILKTRGLNKFSREVI
ncbi:MAG: hypothetical protein A2252_09265 [Elusimicrobia bacterium RIFOXYA2_FULL_39_19]|nr:MAG: hypothetical protein A2252_09265 [Elusimicrobia bacterium RIFOXYA2_FULL_39_19]